MLSIVALALGSLAALSGCSSGSSEQAKEATEPENSQPLVRTVFPEYLGEEYLVEAEGFLRANNRAVISSEISGVVQSRHPNSFAGGFIPAGETIIQIDPAIVRAEYQRAKAQVVGARNALEKARRQFARFEELAAQQFVSKSDRDTVQVRMSEADAALQTAVANQNLAKERLDDASISAPFDLIVISETVNLGETVSPGKNLLVVIGDDGAEVIAGLNRSEAAAVMRAQEDSNKQNLLVTVYSDLSDEPLVGALEAFVPSIGEQARTVDVRVKIAQLFASDGKQPLIFDGDYVRLKIPAKANTPLYRVPDDAIRKNRYIYLVDDKQTLEKVAVSPLSRADGYAIIGLEEDVPDFASQLLVQSRLNEEREGLAVSVEAMRPSAVASNQNALSSSSQGN